MIYIYIYLIGFIEAMVLVKVTDNTVYKNTEKTSLSYAIATSLLSWLAVIAFTIMIISNSKWYKKLDDLWKYGIREADAK